MELRMSAFEMGYLIAWLSVLSLSVVLVLRHPERYEITRPAYWRFLLEPWKVATFLVATAALAAAAPYSGDYTWDYADSVITALFTFTLAPWSVGTLYRAVAQRRIGWHVLVAFCFLMTSCWSYELYILLRDGIYPPTWLPNLAISGSIAVSAGLFWNLAWVEGKGGVFAFTLDHWPQVARTPAKKILLPAVIITIPFVFMLVWFVYRFLASSP